ncbi:hypothetical protein IBA8401_49460 [Pseudomonas syringae]
MFSLSLLVHTSICNQKTNFVLSLFFAHRIYLQGFIYAGLVLLISKGAFLRKGLDVVT